MILLIFQMGPKPISYWDKRTLLRSCPTMAVSLVLRFRSRHLWIVAVGSYWSPIREITGSLSGIVFRWSISSRLTSLLVRQTLRRVRQAVMGLVQDPSRHRLV